MKKILAIVLCLVMLVAVVATTVSADEAKLIDARELQQWGQVHHYLPAVGVSDKPAIDGVIGEDEYYFSFDFDITASDAAVYFKDNVATANNFTNTEWCKCYMSFDGELFYLAMAAKDNYYVIDKDMYMIMLGLTDGPTSLHSVERLRFDFEEDATTGEFKPAVDEFKKNADGSWAADRGFKFEDFVTESMFEYDEDTQIMFFEAAFDVQAMMDAFGNEQAIEDARMYFCPILRMQGGTAEGATDGPVEQGRVWYYMGNIPSEVKMNFTLDYPEESYWGGLFPNIVHFCEEPEPTTPAPTTTAEPTTPAPTTTKAATTKAATTVAANATTAAAAATTAAEATKGCKSTVALSALALVPMLGAAVVFGKKRED